MPTVYFIRHGQSEANAAGIIAGSQDSPLTKLGYEQAQVSVAVIVRSGITFDRLVTSPMSRARDTAQIVAEGIGFDPAKIEVIDGLKERSVGTLEGSSVEELYATGPGDESVVAAGGESYSQLTNRVVGAAEQLNLLPDETVLIVGHSGSYRAAICYKLGMDASEFTYMPRPYNADLLRYPI